MSNESNHYTVPWTGLDVMLFLALFFMAQFACGIFGGVAGFVADSVAPAPQVQIQTQQGGEDKHHGHEILQLVEYGKNSPIILLIALLAVVVAAPLVEEMLFRLFLQGWLESKLSQLNVPWASGIAVVLVSLFFAAIHGGSSENINGEGANRAIGIYVYIFMFIGMTIASLLIFALGIYYLMERRDMKMSHCLFGTKQYSGGQLCAIAAGCFLVILFVLGVSYALHEIAPDTNTDPIPIFFFSLALGYLYSKTHNLSYCILLHACLNATSLTLAWLAV